MWFGFLHVFFKAPLVFVCKGRGCYWGEERREARQFNTRCLKSVVLTGRHKTAWLMESLGMSSPAVLMNLKPKGLMKHAPFAKQSLILTSPDLRHSHATWRWVSMATGLKSLLDWIYQKRQRTVLSLRKANKTSRDVSKCSCLKISNVLLACHTHTSCTSLEFKANLSKPVYSIIIQ